MPAGEISWWFVKSRGTRGGRSPLAAGLDGRGLNISGAIEGFCLMSLWRCTTAESPRSPACRHWLNASASMAARAYHSSGLIAPGRRRCGKRSLQRCNAGGRQDAARRALRPPDAAPLRPPAPCPLPPRHKPDLHKVGKKLKYIGSGAGHGGGQ